MDSKTRIEKTFRFEETDRTPCFEYVLLSPVADMLLSKTYWNYMGDYEKWIEYAAAIGWEKALREYASDRVELLERLGHDLIFVAQNPLPEAVADFQKNPVFCEKTDDEADDPVDRMKRRNEIEGKAVFLKSAEDTFYIYPLIQEELSKLGRSAAIMAPACLHGVWTDVDLMQTMLLDPDTAHEHFHLMTLLALQRIRDYARYGIDIISIGGDFAGNSPMISKELYVEYILPELAVLSREIHNNGAFCVNASDGKLWYVIDEFLNQTGVDGYLEIDSRAGMDLRRLKSLYPDKVYLGNIDCGEVLSYYSEEQIKELTIDCLEAGRGRGHIFTASNAICDSVPLRNYIAMVNAYREYYGLGTIPLL